MKIIFFGTPLFASKVLRYLINQEHEVVAIVCPPDSKKGRGKKIKACAVKKVGLEQNIAVLQPNKLRDDAFINILKEHNADIFVVVAFRMLPQVIWEIPSNGTINLHTSLLPEYRGAAPINWVLINGEKETGVTTFLINNEIDAGEIILQEKVTLLKTTTAGQLHNILINKGSSLLEKTLSLINNSKFKTIKQDPSSFKGAPKLFKALLKINWEKSAKEIHNLVRGLSPFLDKETMLKDIAICPSAYFFVEDDTLNIKRIKVHLTEVIKSNSSNFLEIKTDNKSYLRIVTIENEISIKQLQLEGKKPMTIQQFLHGNKIKKIIL